jgi:hypothetical protein
MQQKYVDLRDSCWYKSETVPEVYREFEAEMLHGAREDAESMRGITLLGAL